MINAQKGLYTTVLRGVQNGKTVEQYRTINSVSRCLNPYKADDRAEYLKLAESEDLASSFPTPPRPASPTTAATTLMMRCRSPSCKGLFVPLQALSGLRRRCKQGSDRDSL